MVDVDGSLELLQASGFELVFDDSSPGPQASAAMPPTVTTLPQGSTAEGLPLLGSQSSAGLPSEEASPKGTNKSESPEQGAPPAATPAKVSNSR